MGLDLSVIILSYNTRNITDECLMHLKEARDFCQRNLSSEIEVIVLDNASEDGSAQMVLQKHPWVKLIESKVNTGFAKGNNIGIRKSTKPYVLLLNSDAFVQKDTLVQSLRYLKDHPGCAVLGPKLIFENGSFQPSGGFLPTPLNIIFWIFGIPFKRPFHPKNPSFFAKARQVGWVTGAFLMTKREILEHARGFDEKFFMYLEEVELCKRIADYGFKICYVPQITVVHLKGASSKFDQTQAYIKELLGVKYYLKKHYSQSLAWIRLFLILGLILRIVAFSLMGKTARARVYVEGLSII